MPTKTQRPWSAEEYSQALAWRDEGLSEAEIGQRLNRTPRAVFSKLWNAVSTNRHQHRFPILHGNNDPATDARLVGERDARREAALRRTTTAELFGDPPPGFSALDRRPGGAA